MPGTRSMDKSAPRLDRPQGGCAIVWRSEITASVTPLDCNHVHLVCGVMLSLDDDSSLLIFNVYMLCDNKREDASYHEYVGVMNEIEQVCLEFPTKN